jgi:hypothetical protein
MITAEKQRSASSSGETGCLTCIYGSRFYGIQHLKMKPADTGQSRGGPRAAALWSTLSRLPTDGSNVIASCQTFFEYNDAFARLPPPSWI